MTKLLESAKAVVENWYQNKEVIDSIEALRQAVQDAEVYTPMTDDERNALIGKWQEDEDWIHSKQNLSQAVEAEVIKRYQAQMKESTK